MYSHPWKVAVQAEQPAIIPVQSEVVRGARKLQEARYEAWLAWVEDMKSPKNDPTSAAGTGYLQALRDNWVARAVFGATAVGLLGYKLAR